jgi:hypothetical protein
MKKILFALTAAALATTALSVPASAGTIGCDQGAPSFSVKATNCKWDSANAPSASTAAFAYVAPSRAIVAPQQRSTLYRADSDYGTTGVSGGSGD